MAEPTLWSRQPGFFIYTAYSIVKCVVKLPCLMFLYIIPQFRPLPEWTYRQALARTLTRLGMEYAAMVEFSPPQSLDQGKEKDRFVTIEPFDNTDTQTEPATGDNQHAKPIYTGIARPDPNGIRPTTIGGTWFPAPLTHPINPTSSQPPLGKRSRRIFLHFHGGAYVLFNGRDLDMAFGARLLLRASAQHTDSATPAETAVFCPQYRLASHPSPNTPAKSSGGGQFPAALQDAITAYAHVVQRLGVDPKQVILSGDSAGGNLALALLRYLEETKVLPAPGGALLWSPWTDLTVSGDAFRAREEYEVDFLPVGLLEWAYRAFLPGRVHMQVDAGAGEGGNVAENAYISPVMKVIETEVPIWVEVGSKEILRRDILKWVEVQKPGCKRLRVFEIPNAPHDVFVAGKGLGFVREAREAAEDAIRFFEGQD